MRTTLGINDALLRELRRRAAESGRPFRAVVEETLQLGLARASQPARAQRPFRVRPHALGLKPGFRGVSLNQLYDQVEAEATARKP
ncbi:antitoxin VapB33 [mine drainage metagenome]|uniref:Antitoxin VapB33 n=1 Tax=mine drainage metagenome TaxID=410659 RepID=A0A1J5TCF3_9ZZZZ